MKNDFFKIDVFSSPTIDFVNNVAKKGGPGYYVSLALYMVGAKYTVYMPMPSKLASLYLDPMNDKPVYIDGYTLLFKIKEDTRRSMILLNEAKSIPIIPRSEYALVSPLYFEVASHDLVKISSTHRLTLVDLQGFTRVRLADGRIVNSPTVILHIIDLLKAFNNIIKISIEDVGYDFSILELIIRTCLENRIPLILTMGKHGALFFEANGCSYTYPLVASSNSIGAGDMLSALTLYAIYKDNSIGEAVAKAVASTACILKHLEKNTVLQGLCKDAFENEDTLISKRYMLCNKCCLGYLPITLKENW